MISGDTSDGYHTFNELYEHRHILFLALLSANKDKAWRSKLHDDGSFLDGWFIAGLKTDLGQATYHLPLRMWGDFSNIQELEHAPKWDGHTSEDVLTRIREFALHPSKQEPPPIDVEALKREQSYSIDFAPHKHGFVKGWNACIDNISSKYDFVPKNHVPAVGKMVDVEALKREIAPIIWRDWDNLIDKEQKAITAIVDHLASAGYWLTFKDNRIMPIAAKHWMPLPEPPTTEETK